MKKQDLERCRAILLLQREQVLGNAARVSSGELDVDPDDFPDEMDAALAESSLSFTGHMRERERGLLNKIEKALKAIERGAYGECESCGEPIAAKRLLARPVASLCIDCQGEQERLQRQDA